MGWNLCYVAAWPWWWLCTLCGRPCLVWSDFRLWQSVWKQNCQTVLLLPPCFVCCKHRFLNHQNKRNVKVKREELIDVIMFESSCCFWWTGNDVWPTVVWFLGWVGAATRPCEVPPLPLFPPWTSLLSLCEIYIYICRVLTLPNHWVLSKSIGSLIGCCGHWIKNCTHSISYPLGYAMFSYLCFWWFVPPGDTIYNNCTCSSLSIHGLFAWVIKPPLPLFSLTTFWTCWPRPPWTGIPFPFSWLHTGNICLSSRRRAIPLRRWLWHESNDYLIIFDDFLLSVFF